MKKSITETSKNLIKDVLESTLISDNNQLRDKLDRATKALKLADIALCDWLHQYAGEFCYLKDVEAARERIMLNGGTVAYIGTIDQEVRRTLAYLKGEKPNEPQKP
jgi:hypothetical protein